MSSKLVIQSALAKKINAKHAICAGADKKLASLILDKCNAARECGIYLIEAKDNVPHGIWNQWIRKNVMVDHSMVTAYMRYAKANPEPIKELSAGVRSLRAHMELGGALSPARMADARPANPVRDAFLLIVSSLMHSRATLTKEIEQTPVDQWTATRREALKLELEPFVELHSRL